MKILAIRGSNIASLAGAFEVDFERPPLSGAGLFAITGPTGAGKSTLLDVLCLALFGKTPRVSEAGALRVPVAGGGADGQAITAQDPRNLLRRGAAEGSAEAEFVGVDGRRYRARWEVRRARGSATGNFQKASWILWRTDGGEETPIANGTTEVEEQVGVALGLTFEQFRKAVLLAQGDFAAFLRAKEKERAELLEKITGAEIYTAVSRKAWERGQEVSDRLKALDERLAALVPMDGEERSRNEDQAAARRNEIGALDDRRRHLEDAKRKAGDATTREREAHDAAGRVEAATLARGEKAGAVEREEEGRRKVAEALDAAREQREARKPELEQARELDAQLLAKGEEARRSEGEAAAARKELATLRAKTAGLDEELRVARATEDGAAKWLAAHAADEPLVRQWAACDRGLSLLVRRKDEIGTEGAKGDGGGTPRGRGRRARRAGRGPEGDGRNGPRRRRCGRRHRRGGREGDRSRGGGGRNRADLGRDRGARRARADRRHDVEVGGASRGGGDRRPDRDGRSREGRRRCRRGRPRRRGGEREGRRAHGGTGFGPGRP